MTPKFSLIIGIAAMALVFAAPAVAVFPTIEGGDSGYGENAGSAALVFDSRTATPTDFWNYDASGQRIADASPGLAPQDLATQFAGAVGVSGLTVRFDNYRLDPLPASPVTVSATDSGSGDWPQIGIGLALGMVALLGIMLAMRHQRIRTLAH